MVIDIVIIIFFIMSLNLFYNFKKMYWDDKFIKYLYNIIDAGIDQKKMLLEVDLIFLKIFDTLFKKKKLT